MHHRSAVASAVALFALAACSRDVSAPTATVEPLADAVSLFAQRGPEPIPGQYIVVFKDDVQDAPGLSQRLAAQHGGTVRHTYVAVIKGFAAQMSAQAAAALERNPNVDYVEQDQVVRTDLTQSGAIWGLDRIDQRSRPLSGTYSYNATASSVRAYIIDTGVDANHAEFEGRAMNVYDAFGGNGNDCNGHGTHVGGTVGGKLYGVAKKVMIRGVKVLDCQGSGSNSGVIAGMDWVRVNHIKPAVANMSLGGGYSSATNTAANNLANAGVFLAVAAGNANADACNYSPASAANATTVAASTSTDAKASFSNWGGCVDLYAPGASIKSAWIGGGTTETNTISGTSMASPHVAGVGALYKATYGDASYSTIRSWIVNNATANVISGNPSGTPNRLLYKAGL